MSLKIVTLSDGNSCKVRQLGLFELDNVGREVLGPYKYSLLLATGQVVEDTYDIRALTYTPTKPDMAVEEIKPGMPEYDQLLDYETYLAALAHEQKRIESYEGYVNDVAQYILHNCLSPEDRNRIVEPGDWDAVYQAALVPQLTEVGVAACLRDTFQGFIWEYGDTRRADVVSQGEVQIVGDSAMGT